MGYGRELSRHIEGAGLEAASRRYAPAADLPPASRTAINNNRTASLGLRADLDGTAIIYATRVNKLVAPDGCFRTALSVAEMVRILEVEPASLSLPGSDHEINPRASCSVPSPAR